MSEKDKPPQSVRRPLSSDELADLEEQFDECDADVVGHAMEGALAAAGVRGRARALAVDAEGATARST